MPKPTGVQVGWLLGTASAPQTYKLNLDLPEGAGVRRTQTDDPIAGDPPRTFEVVDSDGKSLAYITPPLTFDSDGVSVESSMHVVGRDRLVVDVKHHGEDLRYPLFVDPELITVSRGRWSGDWQGWSTYQTPTTPTRVASDYNHNYYGWALDHPAYNPSGAYMSMPTNTWFDIGTSRGFEYRAPPGTYIFAANFGNISHQAIWPTGNHNMWWHGILNPARSAWQGVSSSYNSGSLGMYGIGVPEAYEQNYANIGIGATAANYQGRLWSGNLSAWVKMDWANVSLGDPHPPQLTSAPPANENWSTATTRTRTVSASDHGSGMVKFRLTGPGIDQTTPLSFAGAQNITYIPAEGSHTYTLTAIDAVSNTSSPHTWTEKIDRAPPNITPSGTLYEARDGHIGPNRDSALSLTATDGSMSSPEAYRSGATEVTATLDGRPMTNSPATATCTRPEGSCELRLSTSLAAAELDDLDAGPHTLRMTATDAVGNTTPVQSFSFTYDPEEPIIFDAEQPGVSDFAYSGPPTCSSLPPVAATVVDTAASVAQTVDEAIQTVRGVLPAAVASSTAATTAALSPKLRLDGDGALSTGSLTDLRISTQLDRGFALGSGRGGVCFSPMRISDEARAGVLASDGAMVFANTDQATTTVVRPTATGAETLTVLNDQSAPRSFSWRVNVGEGRRLVTLGDGSVAVVNPHPEPVEDPQMAQDSEIALVNTGLDQLEPNTPVPAGAQALAAAVGDTPAELAGAHDVFARAQNSTLDEVVLVFPKPWALDAAGQPVPASLSTDGDTVTLTVDPASDATFPVIADPAATASAARRGAPLPDDLQHAQRTAHRHRRRPHRR